MHPGENSTYLVFLLQATSEDAHADGVEVRNARFFRLDEALSLPDVTPLSRILITKARESRLRMFEQTVVPPYPAIEFVLFI